jgi:hypothetical protein
MGAATSARYELAASLPHHDVLGSRTTESHPVLRMRTTASAQSSVHSNVEAVPIDDEEEPMRAMPVSRGSLTIFTQPRVERSLRNGVTVLPQRPLLWTDPHELATLKESSPERAESETSTAMGSYPPRATWISSDDNSITTAEPLTVLAVLRQSNRAR